jgi:serine/threonine protein kinase
VQPGDRVLDRYRLDALLDNSRAWAPLWIGRDEVLQRPVAIRIVAAPFREQIVAAAGTAAVVDDGRCVPVLDAAADVGVVVRAWIDGRTLAELLAEGPLAAAESADLVADLADAIASAHDRGLVHGSVDPQHVVIAPGGQVAVVDLAVADALRTADGAEPGTALDDVRGLGGLLYAALTGRWPLPAPSALDRAIEDGRGKAIPPRRAKAGIPPPLDALCRRALGEDVGGDAAFDDARALAVALRSWLRRSGSRSGPRDGQQRRGGARPAGRRGSARAVRIVVGLIVVAFLAATILLAVQVLDGLFTEPDGSPPPGPVGSAPATLAP